MERIRRFEAFFMAVLLFLGVVWQGQGEVQAAELGVAINEANFPDSVFREYVQNHFDSDFNTYLSDAEIEAVSEIDVSVSASDTVTGDSTPKIASLKGIEYFTRLRNLACQNLGLTELDVSQNWDLEHLECNNNLLTRLDVSWNKKLTQLYCWDNRLRELDVTGNPELQRLKCGNTIDESKDTFQMNNRISSLDLSRNPLLGTITCEGNRLRKLDLSHNPMLEMIDCRHNRLSSMDLTNLTGITPTVLTEGNRCNIGTITDNKYDLTQLGNYGFNWTAATDFVSDGENVDLYKLNNVLYRILDESDITYKYNSRETPKISTTFTFAIGGIPITEEYFPDEVFRQYVEDFDLDNDGALQTDERNAVTKLVLNKMGIKDLRGIEYFTKLEHLECNENALTSLDVTKNKLLRILWCDGNFLGTLDVTGCLKLEELYCFNNHLKKLDVTKNTALQRLNCGRNSLTELDVTKNTKMTWLNCCENGLTMLDLSNNSQLGGGINGGLDCSKNHLTSLDIGGCTYLTGSELNAEDNTYNIGEVDVVGYDLDDLVRYGFEEGKAYDWNGGVYADNGVLRGFTDKKITYKYNVGKGCNVTFTLIADAIVHKTHEYEAFVTDPTCTTAGYTTHKCKYCDEEYTDTYVEPLGHIYEDTEVEETCTEDGYTLHTCVRCGYSYKDEYVTKLGHDYSTSIQKATTKSNGKVTKVCDRCGDTVTTVISRPASVTLSVPSSPYVYDGKQKRPGVTVKDAAGKVISGTNYIISYTNNVKAGGKAYATVTFRGDYYTGTLTSRYFTIKPPVTAITSVKKLSKGFKVYWVQRPRQVSGYEIRYSTSKSFTASTTKTVKVNTLGTTFKKITKLKAKKKYYIQVRTYVKVKSDGTYYSDWSKTKSVTTKK